MAKGGSAPAAPDAAATAQAQGQANTSTAASQAALNFVNQNTPYGSTTYTPTGSYTNPEGQTVPRYTQDVQLSPMGQAILGGEQNVANTLIPAAQGLANQAAGSTATPINFNSTYADYLRGGPQQIEDRAADAVYNKQKSYLDPQWQQQEQSLHDQLSRQGIPVGSEAYGNAMKQLDNARTQAYQGARDSATAGGASSAAQMFGLAQAGQNQSIQEQQLAQQQPISLLSQLFGATPSTPTQPIGQTSPTSISPTDVTGATALQSNAAMQQYQAQQQAANATNGGIASLAGTLGVGAMMF